MWTIVLGTLLVFTKFKPSYCIFYENYTLFQATPKNIRQLYFLHSLQGDDSMGIKYWMRPSSLGHSVNLIVPPENRTLFLKKAALQNIKVFTLIKNVQEAFDQQTPRAYIRRNMDTFSWFHFYSLDSIYAWLHDLASKYSDRIKLVSIGRSYEGRDILGVYIPSRGNQSIFVEGGIHAREWISHAVVTYLIHQLVTAKDAKPRNEELMHALKEYSWHLFPVVNPDGYVYSHKEDRNWRKNRHRYSTGIGVDLNRNFDYKFGTVGVSQETYKETYCGPKAFSEPETKALSTYVKKIGPTLKFYFSFHAYGQYIVIPYADTKRHKENFRQVRHLARIGLKKLKSMYGTEYTVGNAYDTVGYVVSGNSVDWVKNTFKVPVAVNLELRDNGRYGFALPPRYIRPTCQETTACLLEMVAAGPGSAEVLDSAYSDGEGTDNVEERSYRVRAYAKNSAVRAVTGKLAVWLQWLIVLGNYN